MADDQCGRAALRQDAGAQHPGAPGRGREEEREVKGLANTLENPSESMSSGWEVR